MSKRCYIESCEDTHIRSFHEFPSDHSLRVKWFKSLRMSEDQQQKLPQRAFVCGLHFNEDCFKSTFSGRKLLRRDAVPTLLLTETLSCPENTIIPSNVEISFTSNIPLSSTPNLFNHHSLNHGKPFSYSDDTAPIQISSLSNIIPLCSTNDSINYHSSNNVDSKSTQVNFISQEEVDEYKKKIKLLEMKIKRLTENNEVKTIQLQEMEKTVNNSNCKAVLKIKEDADNNNTYAIFLLDQILNYGNQKPQFSELTLGNCIMWRTSSPKGYEYCKSTLLKLPCRRTLQRYVGTSKDVTQLITSRLTTEGNCLQPIERVCNLIIYDMAIKEKLHYSRTEDKFYGLETIKQSTNIGKKHSLANKMLCFVIHGLSTKFIIPAGYFFHRTMKTADFYELTLKILHRLHQCGFIVLRMVTDNHKSNVALFRALGENKLLTRIEHPVEPSIPLFLSFDYCHAIKNARNLFLDRNMQSGEGTNSSDYLKDLYKLQKNLIIKPVKFLTEKHLYPSNFEKMNVRRAVEIFSPPVTAAINYLNKCQTSMYDFSNSNATTKFMEMMYTFFQLHDVSDKIQHVKQRDEKCAPYVDITDTRLVWLSTTFPSYIDLIQECSKTHGLKGLTKETAEALKFCARSTSQCIQFLLEEAGFYYVLTRCFSSDAVESMFSNVRMNGGSQDATDVQAADNAIKRILQCGLVKASTSGNVLSDCSYSSTIGQLENTAKVCSTFIMELPEDVTEAIDELQHLSTHLDYGILSASVAFLAGYVARTIEERIECVVCLESILTTSCVNPLLALIHLQDKGALKYPTRRFTCLINQLIKLVISIFEYLPTESNPCDTLTSIIFHPLATSDFFACKAHNKEVCEIILRKLLKPVLTNIGKTQTDRRSSTFFCNSKPLSRKILKL